MHRSEDLAIAALDALSAHIALLDESGNIIAVNQAWKRFAEENGARSNVNSGANYIATCERAHGKDAEYARIFNEGIQKVLQGEQNGFMFEYPCHAPHEERWFICRITRFVHKDSPHIVVAHENISERKKTEQALREQFNLTRAITDNAVEAMFLIDPSGKITFMNPAAETMFGWNENELLGQNLYEKIHHNPYSPLRQIFSSGESSQDQQDVFFRKDHSRVNVYYSNAAIVKNGRVTGAVLVIHDITRRKQAEEQAAHLQELTAAFSVALTPQQIAETIMSQGSRVLEATAGAIMFLSEDGQKLEAAATFGEQHHFKEGSLSLQENTAEIQCVKTRQPIWLYKTPATHTSFLADRLDSEWGAWGIIPLVVDDDVLGIIGLAFPYEFKFGSKDRSFLMSLVQQCAQALARARLSEQAQISAAHEERQHLARELHDAVSQTLFAATTIADTLPILFDRNQDKGFERLNQMIVLNRAAMAEMRTLLLELRPEAIIRTSLEELLRQLGEAVRGRRWVKVDLQVVGDKTELEPDVHVALYRIAQESLNNVSKHSDATEVSLYLENTADCVLLKIWDNGRGFDMSQMPSGFGLGTMHERAASIAASLNVESRIGSGTEISVEWKKPVS